MKLVLRIFLVLFIAASLYLGFLYAWPRIETAGKSSPHKIHLALGFHANMYHSYRIDTNNEEGFGKDIRIIRHIIKVLDEENKKGIPVKGVWDIENLFSLEDTIPKYAPDIITDINRRIKDHGDEVILMSYNNGLASAQNRNEFLVSMKRAIHNKKKSGVKDLFSRWSPYVRPQEMMTTPGDFDLYKSLGIQAVSLYYSSVTFDAFRVFSRELELEEAFNPLLYENKETGEEMVIIPTYNHGDMTENISIRTWLKKLRREQLKGNIKRDILVFINTDADAQYWYGMNVPKHLAWLPNTGGLKQIVESIRDLDYVHFTNLKEYLSTHKPVGKAAFGQDTADGSFNGYVSWAEKHYSTHYWSEVEDDRILHSMVKSFYPFIKEKMPQKINRSLSETFEKRLRLQSTTNFGLATPFLAKGREEVVESVIGDMNNEEEKIRSALYKRGKQFIKKHQAPVDKKKGKYLSSCIVTGKKSGNGDFLTLYLPEKDLNESGIVLESSEGKSVTPAITGKRCRQGLCRVDVKLPGGTSSGVYNVYASGENKGQTLQGESVTHGGLVITFTSNNLVESVTYNGKEVLEKGSLQPRVKYQGNSYRPGKAEKDVKVYPGRKVITLKGRLDLSVTGSMPGRWSYTITLLDGDPSLYIKGDVLFPDTVRKDIFQPNKPLLIRRYDKGWQETIPVEFIFSAKASKKKPFRVLKRNYLGVESSYDIDYFKHSSANLDLANVNNHITAEYASLTNGSQGIVIAMDRSYRSNFAFCPMKIDYSWLAGFSASLNPFGTYFGKQYYQPTWSNGQGYETALKVADQYVSSACTYSGKKVTFSLKVNFFQGDTIPQKMKERSIAFATRRYVVMKDANSLPMEKENVSAPKGVITAFDGKSIFFHWEKSAGSVVGYRVYCNEKGKALQEYRSVPSTSTMLRTSVLPGDIPVEAGREYDGKVEVIGSTGDILSTDVFSFTTEMPKKSGLMLPISLQLKVLISTLLSMLQ